MVVSKRKGVNLILIKYLFDKYVKDNYVNDIFPSMNEIVMEFFTNTGIKVSNSQVCKSFWWLRKMGYISLDKSKQRYYVSSKEPLLLKDKMHFSLSNINIDLFLDIFPEFTYTRQFDIVVHLLKEYLISLEKKELYYFNSDDISEKFEISKRKVSETLNILVMRGFYIEKLDILEEKTEQDNVKRIILFLPTKQFEKVIEQAIKKEMGAN